MAKAVADGPRQLAELERLLLSRLRGDIQLISVTLNSQNENGSGPNFVPSAVRLDEFQATADWPRIAAFVEPAR